MGKYERKNAPGKQIIWLLLPVSVLLVILASSIGMPGQGSGPVSETTLRATYPTELPQEETNAPTQSIEKREWYSQEQAMIDGCLVMQDGDVTHNQSNWMRFMEAVQRGEPAQIKAAHYFRGEEGFSYRTYDIAFDGDVFTVSCKEDAGESLRVYSALQQMEGALDETWEPYDSFLRFTLSNETENLIIYEDLIAEPDYSGVQQIAFHLKEGEPPLISYEDEASVAGILKLLTSAAYTTCPPEDYILGVKLIMTNGSGKELVIELDLTQGVCRYGMQFYKYGTLEDLFSALGIRKWPEEVYAEYGYYLTDAVFS